MILLHFRGGWLLEVKCKKEAECGDSVSRNGESESVLSENQWKECVDPVSENEKEDECCRWKYL